MNREKILAFVDKLHSLPMPDLDNIKPSYFSEPEPNWEQARDDRSKPLAKDPPVPKEYLYYDNTMNAYVYNPKKKSQTVTIQVDMSPEMTDTFLTKVFKVMPEYLPVPYDIPIGVDISICHSARGKKYRVGESAAGWIKWITEHFEASVWASNSQIAAIGAEVVYGKDDMFVMTIVMA